MRPIYILLGLSLGIASEAFCRENARTYAGRVYNPSCPGYFSVLHADLAITAKEWALTTCAGSAVDSVDLVYSYRNAWTKKSWDRPVQVVSASKGEDGWQILLEGEEVASRSSYQFSHLELAWRLRCADGRVEWDNGGRAPLGFYSVALPAFQCSKGTFEELVDVPMAGATSYP